MVMKNRVEEEMSRVRRAFSVNGGKAGPSGGSRETLELNANSQDVILENAPI